MALIFVYSTKKVNIKKLFLQLQQKGNNFLQDIVLDMASTKDDYINARNELLNEYAKVYDTNNPNFNNMVNEEAVASILGQKLGNQEFINELTTQKRSIAKVIYDNVVSLLNKLNKLTGYKSEKLYWTDVKNKFENAYRSTSISSKKSDTKYSLSNSKENKEYDTEKLLEKYVYPEQVYETYKNENKEKITESVEELKKYKENLDTDTDEGWGKNFEINAKIKALESGVNDMSKKTAC